MKRNTAKWLGVLWCCVWGMVSVVAGTADALPVCDFSSGHAGWSVKDGTIATEPLGNKYMHLVAPITGPSMPLLQSPDSIPVTGSELQVAFRHRNDVENSGMHRGAWVYVQFAAKDGRALKVEVPGLALPAAGSWSRFKGTMKVPTGSAVVRLQIRIQNRQGKFLDLDDIRVRFVNPQVTAEANPLRNPDLKVLASFTLQSDLSLKSSSGESLPNLSSPGEPPSYILPDKYCSRPELSYGVTVKFRTNWTGSDTQIFNTAFSLGSVFSGQDGNSVEAAFVARKRFMFRARCEGNKGSMNWAFNPNAQTKPVTASFYLARNELQCSTGPSWKKVTSSVPFVWENGRRFYIGGTGPEENRLKGRILAFNLTVYKPGIMASLPGGLDDCVFQGKGPHRWRVRFQEKNGKACRTTFRIKDCFGKEQGGPKVVNKTDDYAEFVLPSLPYGWYELTAEVSAGKASRTLKHAFVVIRKVDLTASADDSPIGITQGGYDADKLSKLFRAAALAGNRWFRFWATWDQVEKQPGVRNWSNMDKIVGLAEKNGLQLYVCLSSGGQPWQTSHEPGAPKITTYLNQWLPRDMAQWQSYVTEFAGRYKGRINYFQIGNECDTKEFFQPFSAESYFDYLKAGHAAVKKGNPDAKVGLCGFAAAFGRLDAPKRKPGERIFFAKEFWALHPEPYYDIVDCHFYSMGAVNFYWDSHIPKVIRFNEFLKAKGEGNKPLWNSETGFESGKKGELGAYSRAGMISPFEQACRLVEWHVQSQAVGIQRSFNYLVTGTSGLYEGDLSPRPSCVSSANLAHMLPGMVYERTLPLVSGLQAYQFHNPGTGENMIVVWSRIGSFPLAVVGSPEAKLAKVDLFGNRKELNGAGGVVPIMVDEAPVYLVSQHPVELVSVVTASQEFSTEPGKALLGAKVVNPTKTPMHCVIGAGFAGNPGARQEFDVAAGGKKDLVLTIPEGSGNPTVSSMISLNAAKPLTFSTVIPYVRRQIAVVGEGAQVAEFCINTAEQLKIGGVELDDQNRPITENRWDGALDVSAKVKLSREDGKLLFEIDVTDNQVITEPSRQPYDQDCVELFYAVLDDSDQATQRGQIILRADGKVFPMGKASLPDLTVKSSKTAYGYRLSGSFAIPEQALKQGRMLLDFAVDDADSQDTGRRCMLVWSGTKNNFQSADSYGVIVLK